MTGLRLADVRRVGAAAAAVLILALGVVAAVELGRVRVLTSSVRLLSARLAAQEPALALVASPGARTIVLRGTVPGHVRVLYDRVAGRAALVASDLGDPGGGRVYQVWLLADEGPISAGVFRPVSGQPVVLPVRGDLRRFQTLAISIEPGPRGSPGGPTSAPVLTAGL